MLAPISSVLFDAFIDALCKSELCKSKGEARRLIKGGGARINDVSYFEENYLINKNHIYFLIYKTNIIF
mgnify:CR=1 FL=1